jgi:hypothetical protein
LEYLPASIWEVSYSERNNNLAVEFLIASYNLWLSLRTNDPSLVARLKQRAPLQPRYHSQYFFELKITRAFDASFQKM